MSFVLSLEDQFREEDDRLTVNNEYIKINKIRFNSQNVFIYKKQISEVVMNAINWEGYLNDTKK